MHGPSLPTDGFPPRRKRTDARLNDERLIAAARSIFTEQGTGAPLDQVAKLAGIANATLYRHFPDRRDLVIAVYGAELAALCESANQLSAMMAPIAALEEWLRRFIKFVASKRELAFTIADDPPSGYSNLVHQWHEMMRSTAGELIRSARSQNAINEDVTAVDILAIASGIAVSGVGEDQTSRSITLFMRAIVAAERNRPDLP